MEVLGIPPDDFAAPKVARYRSTISPHEKCKESAKVQGGSSETLLSDIEGLNLSSAL